MTIVDLVTLPDLLHASAECFRARPVVGEMTYGELQAAVCLRAHELRHEFATGTPVVLDGPAGPEWITEFFAIIEAGLVAVPLLPGMDRARVERLVGNAPVEAGTALLVCTSASEIKPVIVRHTHASLLADHRALLAARRVDPGDTLLSVLPPAHLFELMAGLLGPIACGARIVHQGVPLPHRILARIRAESVCRVLLVPALFEMIVRALVDEKPSPAATLAAKLRRHPDPRALRRTAREALGDAFDAFVVGGAALDPAWKEIAGLLGFRLEVGYGLTEAGPIVALGDAAELPVGSCGRPLPGIEVKVGGCGEILVRGPNVMAGYHGDRRATAAAFRNGWLRTGDRGRLDRDGCLYIDGRIKDAIVPSTGETFWPPEIEEHYASELFAEFCVAPRRAADGNDEAVLFVVPRDGDHGTIEREFHRLRRAAPKRARVKRMRIVDGPFPRTVGGNVRRRDLARDREHDLRLLIEEATGESLERFGIEDDLMAELAVDSLAALRVLALVEQRFDVRIPDDRLGDFRCLARLLEVIEHGKEAA
ncbi:MAG: AMP-binding protein [Planctomycetota bacterium]